MVLELETMRQPSKSQGIILITAVFIVFLISTLGIGYLAFVNNQVEMAGVGLKSAKAFYYAESGISAIILYLKEINNWEELAGALISGNFDEGEYKVEVVSGGAPSRITIKSTGNMSNFQRIIEVTLDKAVVPGKIIQQDWKEV